MARSIGSCLAVKKGDRYSELLDRHVQILKNICYRVPLKKFDQTQINSRLLALPDELLKNILSRVAFEEGEKFWRLTLTCRTIQRASVDAVVHSPIFFRLAFTFLLSEGGTKIGVDKLGDLALSGISLEAIYVLAVGGACVSGPNGIFLSRWCLRHLSHLDRYDLCQMRRKIRAVNQSVTFWRAEPLSRKHRFCDVHTEPKTTNLNSWEGIIHQFVVGKCTNCKWDNELDVFLQILYK